jgi:hypothetical protein
VRCALQISPRPSTTMRRSTGRCWFKFVGLDAGVTRQPARRAGVARPAGACSSACGRSWRRLISGVPPRRPGRCCSDNWKEASSVPEVRDWPLIVGPHDVRRICICICICICIAWSATASGRGSQWPGAGRLRRRGPAPRAGRVNDDNARTAAAFAYATVGRTRPAHSTGHRYRYRCLHSPTRVTMAAQSTSKLDRSRAVLLPAPVFTDVLRVRARKSLWRINRWRAGRSGSVQ